MIRFKGKDKELWSGDEQVPETGLSSIRMKATLL